MNWFKNEGLLCFMAAGLWVSGPVGAQDVGFADDLLVDPAVSTDRYFPLDDVDGVQGTASHANGVLTLAAESTGESRFRNRLSIRQPTDYLEATFSLSSASELGVDGRVAGIIEKTMYNSRAEGETDNSLGKVNASLTAEIRADGRATMEYCLSESIDSEGNDSVGLLSDGESCRDLPMRVEFDVPIRAAITLNREAGTVTFQANEFGRVVSIEGPFFDHGDPYSNIIAQPRNLATAVLDIDEIRSSPSALTDTEVNSGATQPLAFAPIQENAAAVDSTIAFPFTETTPIGFIDDFSQPTSLLVFDPPIDRNTIAGIAFIDGALEIEAAQIDPEDCCGDGRLRIQERTDFVGTRVTLSSESQVALDGEVGIRIEGTWYNDTQDGGFDERGGDVFARLEVISLGNGARQAGFCLDRELGNGDNEDLDIVDGDNCGRFNTIPDLDTEYDLSVSLDREAATMTFTFGDETQVVDLGGAVFDEARAEKSIIVQHQGSSGRVSGALHSISTDSGTIDFADEAPLIGPYRPLFSTRSAGREVAVVDGRLRIEVDSAIGEGNQPRFVSRNPSEYVSASVEVSSESRLDGEFVRMGVGGQMYNDIMDGGVGGDSNEGAVFGATNMIMNDEGEDYIEYCAFRSNNSDFSEATELLGDDGETCPRFTLAPSLDTPVTLVVAIDRSRGVLIFSADEETVEYTITTDAFTPSSYFNGIRADANGGSRLVGFADDLAYSENPVPLADSPARIGFAAGIDDGSSVNVEIATEGDVEGSGGVGGGSGGGGGCSIASGSGGMGAPLLMFLAMLILRLRRFAMVRLTQKQESRRLG